MKRDGRECRLHARRARCVLRPHGSFGYTRAATLTLLTLSLAGCNGGVRWQGPTFQDAHSLGRDANKLTFVYFRSWYLVECKDFEEKVLKSPDVLAETRTMVCVPLDFDWDRPLARRWRLEAVPAFAIVAPNGDLLARKQAPITREELLQAIHGAKTVLTSTTQRASTVPATPP